MLPTQDRLPSPLRTSLLLGLLVWTAAGVAAEPDPVKQFLEGCKRHERIFGDPARADEAKKQLEELTKLADGLPTLSAVSEVLRTAELGRHPVRQTNPAFRDLLGRLGKRLETLARAELTAADADRVGAAAGILESLAPAMSRFGGLRPALRRLAPDLLKAAERPEVEVKVIAIRVLAEIDMEAQTVGPALVRMVADGKPPVVVRRAILEVAARWQEKLNGPRCRTWPEPGEPPETPTEKIVEQIAMLTTRSLVDADAAVRRLGIQILRPLILHESFAAPDPERDLRWEIEDAFKEFLPIWKSLETSLPTLNPPLESLVRTTEDVDPETRQEALRCLEEAILLRNRLRDFDRVLRSRKKEKEELPDRPLDATITRALKDAAAKFARSLAHDNLRVRVASLHTLELLDARELSPVTEQLLKCLGDSNEFVRWGAVRALAPLEAGKEEKVVPKLTPLLKDPSADVRLSTAATLEKYGPRGALAVTELSTALKSNDADLRLQVCRALGAIGKEARKAEAALAGVLTDREAEVRAEAARALGRIGVRDRATTEGLRKLLTDTDENVRREAATALLQTRKE
jgi:HEAT repeat protein